MLTQAIKLSMTNSCEDWEWQDALEDLKNNFLMPISEELNFHIVGRNMGWQNQEGWMEKQFEDAEQFCFGVFPDCGWNADFKLEDGRLFITLYHHDSPTGESYEVKKAKDGAE